MTTPVVLVIVGPTAVGKTAISIELAEALGGEIISADSRLFYVGMDIGTAKPGPEILRRVPHHLIDVSSPDDTWSLERYLQAATQAILAIHQHGKLPMLVGGTGQYIRGLLDGWRPPPKAKDDRIRKELQAFADQQGAEALHRQLESVDPKSAKRIDFRNVRRVIRALEVYRLTGAPFSLQRNVQPPDFKAIRIGLSLSRNALYERIDQRIDQMLQDGWVQEVESLVAKGYGLQHPALSAIGYQQLIEYLQGDLVLVEAVAKIKRLTRQYVRRQANWFKPDDAKIRWFEANPDVVDQILTYLESSHRLGRREG